MSNVGYWGVRKNVGPNSRRQSLIISALGGSGGEVTEEECRLFHGEEECRIF